MTRYPNLRNQTVDNTALNIEVRPGQIVVVVRPEQIIQIVSFWPIESDDTDLARTYARHQWPLYVIDVALDDRAGEQIYHVLAMHLRSRQPRNEFNIEILAYSDAFEIVS